MDKIIIPTDESFEEYLQNIVTDDKNMSFMITTFITAINNLLNKIDNFTYYNSSNFNFTTFDTRSN